MKWSVGAASRSNGTNTPAAERVGSLDNVNWGPV
jgi:hypothetical protein